jgi:BirA family biotin operon repressor/biotin-[acetyl-CoA-carboxylase] ligase
MTVHPAEDREGIIIERLLGSPGYISGEEIAQRLRISRTAVWNHVSALKRLGFQIESQPHLGYRLAAEPDVLLPAVVRHELDTDLIARRIVHLDRAASSSDEAERLARQGEPEGTVVIVEEQTAGRGRVGREWRSPRRRGIYLSVILRPALSPARVSFLTLCSAVAAQQAIQACAPAVQVSVKWPNDVLIGGRKVCGILTELTTEADRINHAVVGVGMNANHSPEDLAGIPAATSLRIETGGEVSRPALARAFLRSLDAQYALLGGERYAEIIDRWLDASATVGRRVRVVSLSGERWEGVATGLDDDGCLLLRLDTGMTRRVTGGDVTLL